jgi:hypothetical protein
MSDPVKNITVCSIIDNSMVLEVGQLAEGVGEAPLVHDDYNAGGESEGVVLGGFHGNDLIRMSSELFLLMLWMTS